MVYGFRRVFTASNVTAQVDIPFGAQYIEVTNGGATAATVYVNNFPDNGSAAVYGIPVAAGTTRVIPMLAYNISASQAVTVVAYGA